MIKSKAKFLSVRGASELTGASTKFIYAHLAKGDFPGRRVGRKIFISEAVLIDFLEQRAAPVALARKEETANDK